MSQEPQPRRWPIVAGVAASVLVVAAVFLVAHLPQRPALQYAPGEASGDPLDIRLAQIWPLDGPDVLDADGEIIGQTLGVMEAFRPLRTLHEKRLMFVLDIPPVAGEVAFSGRRRIAPCGGGRSGILNYSAHYGALDEPLDGRLFARVDLPLEYTDVRRWPFPFSLFMRSSSSKVEYTRIDYTVYYWYGPRGEAAATLEGPFEPKQTISSAGLVPFTLEVSSYYSIYGESGAHVALSSTAAHKGDPDILCYDKAGRRFVPQVYSLSSGAGGTRIKARVAIRPEDIAFITVGEAAREKTFHNIAVAWPGRPSFTRPTHWDEFVERLGLGEVSDSSLEYYDFKTAADALKVADIVCGRHIESVWSKIINQRVGLDFAALEEADRHKLLSAARAWAASVDPRIRRCGADLGMRLDFHEFAPAALDLLANPMPRVRKDISYEFARHGAELTAGELERLKDLLLNRDTAEVHSRLVECLAQCSLAEAAAVFREFAGAERTQVWWIAFATDEGRRALGDEKDWPLEFKVRAVLAGGFEVAERFGEDAAAEAARRLPGLVSADLQAVDSTAFGTLFHSMLDRCDRETVLGAVWRFLEEVRDAEAAGDEIAMAVRVVNREYGLDVARLGRDPAAPLEDEYYFNWRQVADDALAWRKAGKLPCDAPEGSRAGERDIRFVLKDNSDGEKSDIVLCTYDDQPRRVRMIESGGRHIFFQVSAETHNDHPGYAIEMNALYISGSMTFSADQLPLTLYERAEFSWICERADSPDSVLSGTKVFADWWDKYGPAASGTQPRDVPGENAE